MKLKIEVEVTPETSLYELERSLNRVVNYLREFGVDRALGFPVRAFDGTHLGTAVLADRLPEGVEGA